MTEADETAAVVAALALKANQLLTTVAGLIQNSEELAAEIRGVVSHNLDLATAAGVMQNSVPEDLRTTANRLRLVIQILEQYAGKIR
jgi:acetylglutamate kinase